MTYQTETLRSFIGMATYLYDKQKREVSEEYSALQSDFKSAVYPVMRPRAVFQPRNVFHEFPAHLSRNVIKEISASISYPGSGENCPYVISFNNFYLTENRQAVIVEASEVVPSIIRAETDIAYQLDFTTTNSKFIQGWPDFIKDQFNMPKLTRDRVVQIQLKWRSYVETISFSKILSTFFYPPVYSAVCNRGVRVERDGLVARVTTAVKTQRSPVYCYFVPDISNEIKFKVVYSRRGFIEIGWADVDQYKNATAINLYSKEISPPTIGNSYFPIFEDSRVRTGDVISIKRINFMMSENKAATDGIAISRSRRADDPRGMPYIFLGALELYEEKFEHICIWLKDVGDCLMMIE